MEEQVKGIDPSTEILRILFDYDPKRQNEILATVKKELLKVREDMIKEAESRKNYLIDSIGGL